MSAANLPFYFTALVALIGLQTFWISFGMNKIHRLLERQDAKIDAVSDELNDKIDTLRGDLHKHEIACKDRDAKTELRFDRLEQRQAK